MGSAIIRFKVKLSSKITSHSPSSHPNISDIEMNRIKERGPKRCPPTFVVSADTQHTITVDCHEIVPIDHPLQVKHVHIHFWSHKTVTLMSTFVTVTRSVLRRYTVAGAARRTGGGLRWVRGAVLAVGFGLSRFVLIKRSYD